MDYNHYTGEARCTNRTAHGNQKGIFNPPTGSMEETPRHRTHTNMGEVVQVSFVAYPPALSTQGPLGTHYTTEKATNDSMTAIADSGASGHYLTI